MSPVTCVAAVDDHPVEPVAHLALTCDGELEVLGVGDPRHDLHPPLGLDVVLEPQKRDQKALGG